jgi:GT2 family glycosyltransferase
MIVIVMPIFDTVENKRSEYTQKSVHSLLDTINHETTKIVLVDNNSCAKTRRFLNSCEIYEGINVVHNGSNIGTAEAVNVGIKNHSDKGDYIIKIDNDIVVYDYGWADKMKQCFDYSELLGVLGLKRKDLPNQPDSTDYPTRLRFLFHYQMQPWIVVEECSDIIGSCTMFSPKLLEKIGYMYQPGLYGFDDNLMCLRSLMSGFYNAFYPSVEIEHLDDGKNPFTTWKKNYADQYWDKFEQVQAEFKNGTRPLYYNPFEK